jgi:two-component system, cell cycle sensor histidine kinase and response regulator CckA
MIDQQFEPWRMDAAVRGYASVLSLPLKSGDQVFGALTMYSMIPDAFNGEETVLLTALADNLSYGITILQTRKARDLAEDALRQSEARYRSLFQNHHTIMLIIDPDDGVVVDANPAAVNFYMKNILNVATRSADLTRQLLAFARKQTVMPLVLELNTMVENLLSVLRRLIGENITIKWIPDTHRALVKVDPSQIDQILANLCINARDSMGDIGTITIKIGRFCDKKQLLYPLHPCIIPGDYVTLSVSDTGCGIEKEHLPHIFEPFFTTKALGKGIGLGLSTVYGIVKQNNGCIDYISEPGKGSSFKIHLPRHKEGYADSDDDGQPPKMEKFGNKTILLVENEHDILVLCKVSLEQAGYTILSAGTPHAAIQLALQHKDAIDLLLTDVIMPEMNGCDLAKRLLSVIANLKILFMSGYSNDIIAHSGLMSEGANFIQKPFSLISLTMTVQNILKHSEP